MFKPRQLFTSLGFIYSSMLVLPLSAVADTSSKGSGYIAQISSEQTPPLGKIDQLSNEARRNDVSSETNDHINLTHSRNDCELTDGHRELLGQLSFEGYSFENECEFLVWLSEDIEGQTQQRIAEGVASGEIARQLTPIEPTEQQTDREAGTTGAEVAAVVGENSQP